MKLNKIEIIDLQNLLKIIRRAKFDDFQGIEALALSRAYSFLERSIKEAELEAALPPPSPQPLQQAPIAPALPPISPDPKIELIEEEKPKSKKKQK